MSKGVGATSERHIQRLIDQDTNKDCDLEPFYFISSSNVHENK